MKLESKADSLFLHMGPGLHAEIEAQLLGKELWPSTVWFWNQPPATSFSALAQSATLALGEVFSALQKPVKLVAHSFGVHLGAELLKHSPHQVGDCHFIAPCLDPFAGFYRLLNILMAADWVSESWRQRAKSVAQELSENMDLNGFWRLISTLLECEDFMRAYWVEESNYRSYQAMANSCSAMDFQTFQSVLESFFGSPPQSEGFGLGQKEISQPIHFYMGQFDPFVSFPEERLRWQKVFPKATFTIFPDSGHFPHLEGRGQMSIAESLKEGGGDL